MCFSATASFAAAGGLAVIGAATIAKATSKQELPFASIPTLFAAQQAIEGVVWVSFGANAMNEAAVYAYSLFSQVLWPLFVPLAVLLVEPDPDRRKTLTAISLIGSALAAYLLFEITAAPVTAQIVDHCIRYVTPHLYPLTTMTLYLVVTCGSCLISSHALIKRFGIALSFAFVIAAVFYYFALFSVWCFFSALLSVYVYLFISARHRNVRG